MMTTRPTPLAVSALAALCLLLALPRAASAQDNNTPPEGFTALFNGRDLAGWTGGTTRNPKEIDSLPDDERARWYAGQDAGVAEHWRVEAGELVSDGHEPHLVTTRDYGDFEMLVDYKIQPGGDSGIYLRGCPQVQIWDPAHQPAHQHGSDKGSGGLWNNQVDDNRWPSAVADRPAGEWNRMRIKIIGQYVTVTLNGVTVVRDTPLENYYDRGRPVFMTGPIHLQTHGSETRFRNVFVREIGTEEANAYLGALTGDDDTFTPLFNGEDLTGWTGARDHYEVVDGAIRCKQGRGGNLITQDQYTDFVVRLEFKLPPGGNNGLAIRTPNAEVTPAHDALEIQVLDDTHPKYADLKDYQYHGGAYTVAAAHRGYLRPVGDWNYQQVTVIGDHVTVELNGFVILDTHLAQANPDHPSAKQTRGHFGFCGHNDPVAFRAIRIREVE